MGERRSYPVTSHLLPVTPWGQVPLEWSLPPRVTRNRGIGSKQTVTFLIVLALKEVQRGCRGPQGWLGSHKVMLNVPRRPEASVVHQIAVLSLVCEKSCRKPG